MGGGGWQEEGGEEMLKKGGNTTNKMEGIKVHGGRVNFHDFGTGTAGKQGCGMFIRLTLILLHFKYFQFGYI